MKKHHFLLYKRLREMLLTPALLIFIVALAAALLPSPALKARRGIWFLLAGASFLLTILIWLVSRSGYVQVAEEGLEVKSLLGEINIPYKAIESVSLTVFGKVFEPARQNFSQRMFLHPFWFETVLALKLKEFPFSPLGVRLLFGKYLYEPRKKILALLVEDWQELNLKVNASLERRRLEGVDFEERRYFPLKESG